MKNRLLFVAALLIFTIPFNETLYAQEFAYVTDSLQLRVYSSASASSEVLQSIDSGDSVEVFATENGFSKVTTYDGTVGWVKSAFLVVDPPAKLLYYSVSEKNKELEAEIEALKSSAQNSTTTTNNEADANIIYELKAALSKEQEINHKLQQQLDDSGSAKITNSVSVSSITKLRAPSFFENNKWLLLALPLVLLVAGLLLGIKISSWRMRKRLHGFRI